MHEYTTWNPYVTNATSTAAYCTADKWTATPMDIEIHLERRISAAVEAEVVQMVDMKLKEFAKKMYEILQEKVAISMTEDEFMDVLLEK